MVYLLIVSVLWGFSFGLIKVEFSGLPPDLLSLIRLGLASIFFLPFLRFSFRSRKREFIDWLLLGAIQYGLMYLCLFYAFHYLAAYEVALLTVFTPLFVVLFHEIQTGKWITRSWISASIAVVGVILIKSDATWPDRLQGILLMQISNAAFAFGQLHFKNLRQRYPKAKPKSIYSLVFLGAVLICLLPVLWNCSWQSIPSINSHQWFALFYLGWIASGWCFFAWNIGATQVNPTTLAVFNNLKIPIAVLISIVVFGESAHWISLFAGSFLLLIALYLAHRKIA